jgi:hypothetical protein
MQATSPPSQTTKKTITVTHTPHSLKSQIDKQQQKQQQQQQQ